MSISDDAQIRLSLPITFPSSTRFVTAAPQCTKNRPRTLPSATSCTHTHHRRALLGGASLREVCGLTSTLALHWLHKHEAEKHHHAQSMVLFSKLNCRPGPALAYQPLYLTQVVVKAPMNVTAVRWAVLADRNTFCMQVSSTSILLGVH